MRFVREDQRVAEYQHGVHRLECGERKFVLLRCNCRGYKQPGERLLEYRLQRSDSFAVEMEGEFRLLWHPIKVRSHSLGRGSGRVAHPLDLECATTGEGAPSLRCLQGWEPRTPKSGAVENEPCRRCSTSAKTQTWGNVEPSLNSRQHRALAPSTTLRAGSCKKRKSEAPSAPPFRKKRERMGHPNVCWLQGRATRRG